MAGRGFDSLADILGRVVRRLDLEQPLGSHSVHVVWEGAVGARTAMHSRPVELRGGLLVVEVRSNAWMNELSFHREELCRALNAASEGRFTVRELRFRVGALPPAPKAPPAPLPPPRDEEIEQARNELGGEELGEGARLAARVYARRRRPAG